MRRVLFSLLVVGVVFALAYGAAASLSVTSGVVQAGSDNNLNHFKCDNNGVNVSYTVAWDSGNKRFEVTQVTVSDIDNACDGQTIAVQLTGSGGAGLGGTSATIPSSPSTSVALDVSSAHIAAADVQDVHVAIY